MAIIPSVPQIYQEYRPPVHQGIAYPAKYGSSGIMTFIVNQNGVIYEKDLDEKTLEAAAAVTIYDPDETWSLYEEVPPGITNTPTTCRDSQLGP